MSVAEKKHLTVTARMALDHSPESIWPLLCPVREYDWIEMWQCELMHSVSGFNELGCVFRTDFPTEGGLEVWTTSRFDPVERIEFVRTSAWRTIRFIVTLSPQGRGTLLTWTQHVTALNDEGRKYLETKPEDFSAQMATLETLLAYYLDNGQRLEGRELGLTERIKHHVHGGKTG